MGRRNRAKPVPMEENMNKTVLCCLVCVLLLGCLLCGCGPKAATAGDEAPGAAPTQTETPLPGPDPEAEPEPEISIPPQPEPEITPPAQTPFDPASGTDVIYESETRPPDPASDTDLDTQ